MEIMGREAAHVGFFSDISERKAAEREFLESERRFRGIVETAGDAIFSFDESRTIVMANRAPEETLGYGKGELTGSSLRHLIPPKYGDSWKQIERYGASGSAPAARSAAELTILAKSGKEIPVRISMAEKRRAGKKVITVILRDISAQKAMEEELRLLSITDALTRLYNRRHFHSLAQQELDRARRTKTVFSLLLADVDYFKRYNDAYGHVEGDRVLRTAADVLRKNFRSMDSCFRLGREEFVVPKGATVQLVTKMRGTGPPARQGDDMPVLTWISYENPANRNSESKRPVASSFTERASMCRMIGFVSAEPLDIASVLAGLSRFSRSGNLVDRWERRPGGNHPDGWGVAYRRDGEFRLLRSGKPANADPAFSQVGGATDRFIGHVRYASNTETVNAENAHPFLLLGTALAHNGTFRGAIGEEAQRRNVSDTLIFLERLSAIWTERSLSCLREALARILDDSEEVGEYSAANLLIASGGSIFALRRYRRDGDYYTLHLKSVPGQVVVASEPLDDGPGWRLLDDGELVELRPQASRSAYLAAAV